MYRSTTYFLTSGSFCSCDARRLHWEKLQLLGRQCTSWPDINQTPKSIWVSVQRTAYLSWNFVIIVKKKKKNKIMSYGTSGRLLSYWFILSSSPASQKCQLALAMSRSTELSSFSGLTSCCIIQILILQSSTYPPTGSVVHSSGWLPCCFMVC